MTTIHRDTHRFEGGMDILRPDVLSSAVGASFAVVGLTSATMSAVSLSYNATTATASDTNKMLARVIYELQRKGVVRGTSNT